MHQERHDKQADGKNSSIGEERFLDWMIRKKYFEGVTFNLRLR